MEFQLVSPFQPAGDQPQAIGALTAGVRAGRKQQVLMGVTGSGKTFTMANIIQQIQKPTLVLSHNKTLAAQLYSEFKEFFPHNAVQYFVSYYDYYQPEAYIPQRDIYIEKDASINQNIDRLRLAATSALVRRQDVVIVASVSCIYGLGSPDDYKSMMVSLTRGQQIDRDELLLKLVDVQYERNDIEFARGKFRVRGDCVELGRATKSLRCGSSSSATKSSGSRTSTLPAARPSRGATSCSSTRPSISSCRKAHPGGRRSHQAGARRPARRFSRTPASCSKPSGSTPARGSTSR